uniref:Protein tanc2 n=1 Tax=Caenorhabditis tropicalis TaxID=1561998 RepID=A0A1I7T7D8_9PELO
MNMTYKLNDLTEEIFGHLCNVALHKCSDKTEKKRAGCGGRAMRKRVLIKNFVSDLFKMPKKPATSREQDMASSDEEYDDYDSPELSFYEEEVEEFRIEDLTTYEQNSMNDVWLHQPQYATNDMLGGGGSGFGSMAGMSYNSSYTEMTPSHSSYHSYYGSSMSESATEGDLPLASDPLASMSGMIPESSYEFPTSSPAPGFFPGDDYFMSNGVCVEPIFTSTSPEPLHEDTHELTDLDVATGESHANKNKRRSTELFDDFNVTFQKRIKI